MSRSYLAGVVVGLMLAASAAFGQKPAAPAFEVATVKPAGPPDPAKIMSGQVRLGVNISDTGVDIGLASLSDLIRTAYGVKPYQISGPSWINTERFDIQAKFPEGATRKQAPEMLQALLAERFKLTMHRESKEHAIYALVVRKNGPKLKEAADDADAPAGEPPKGALTIGEGPNKMTMSGSPDGKGLMMGGPNGPMRMSMGPGGSVHMEAAKMSIAALADMLSRLVDRPVVDMTDLKGNYQIGLDISMETLRTAARSAGIGMPGGPLGGGGDPARAPVPDAASDPSGPSIFTVVQQLGLKLEPRKAPMNFIVIDHLEKTPTEN